jgi:hypothetical protein
MKILSLFMPIIISLSLNAQTIDKLVAYDNCGVSGKQPHVTIKSGDYLYSFKDIPASTISKNDPLRSVIYGDRKVGLTYGGLKAKASYKLRLRFISDHPNRVQRIKINDKIVVDKLALPKSKEVIQNITIPRECYKTGKIEVLIETIEGLNSVLSDATLFSNDGNLNSYMELVCGVNPGPMVAGKVIDLNSAKPIADASVSLGSIKTKSKQDGSFKIKIQDLKKDAVLKVKKGKLSKTQLFTVEEFSIFQAPRLSQRPQKNKRISLNGTWNFSESLPKNFPTQLQGVNKQIKVPGEWVMQGFEVKKNTPAAYYRHFTVPTSMRSKRIKLRFDAVYSDCKVYVNGKKVGQHIGGFTPFELDITQAVKIGKANTLALSVQNESLADTMSSGSKYACHQLGGINRKVTLFSLPQANISSLAIRTDLDKNYVNAKLNIELGVTNDGKTPINQSVKLYLLDAKGNSIPLKSSTVKFGKISPKQETKKTVSFNIANPEKWTNETPTLYQLKMKLSGGEIFTRKFGFKEVHVDGTTFFVNGRPVKLRGCNRHEVHPLTGRSLYGDLWAQDVKLFRNANINLIRTCHYPPGEELLEAADEMGIFVEVEGPFCWEWKSKDPTHLKLTVKQNMEMVIYNRNHPSVLVWSIANESGWGPNFIAASKAMRILDPTRPQIWNSWYKAIQKHTEEHCEFANIHYPGYNGPKTASSYNKRPVYFGEYIHLNAYNRLELASDRGLRDQWGNYFTKIWEMMYEEPTVVGGSIWSGIDDTFYLKDDKTIGYGTWGPIDGWRRKKPEWYHVKKVYSPIRILNQNELKVINGVVTLKIENRQDFSNLNHLTIAWRYGNNSGTISPDIGPKKTGTVNIKVGKKKESTLFLTFTDPRGFEIDRFALPLVPRGNRVNNMRFYNCKITQKPSTIKIKHGDLTYSIDKSTGLFTSVRKKETMEISGPHLMLLSLNSAGSTQMTGKTLKPKPFTSTCKDWKKETISIKDNKITVTGYYKEAKGKFIYQFNGDGNLNIDYDFTSKRKINPRQIGLVFDIPKEFNQLSWDRKGLWTTYPKDHIGRLKGEVNSEEGVEASSVGPRTQPSHPWRLDRGPAGSHDFSSSKHNIYKASLTKPNHKGIITYANADRHIRAWICKDHLRLLIAHYSNGGSERFLRRLSSIDDKPLKVGSKVKSSITLNFSL